MGANMCMYVYVLHAERMVVLGIQEGLVPKVLPLKTSNLKCSSFLYKMGQMHTSPSYSGGRGRRMA